ncbi:MAG: hypothetical protein HC764_17730 [Pleurocapsa sp. CRU_1_2]|nr:hypothetical protein [Pleurocapsa sp. CRU_1_2]
MIGFVAPFQILEYLDRLNVVKETSSEYHCLCPVCGDGGFKVNKKNGSYQAFKCGCEVKDIREAVRPWSEVKPNQRQNKGQKKTLLPVTQTDTSRFGGFLQRRVLIDLARLPEIPKDIAQAKCEAIPKWLRDQGVHPDATQTRYWYSKTQWVSRFEWKNADGTGEKTIRQGHIKSNGLREWKKGVKTGEHTG